jgi:cytidylate kinase
VKIFLTASEAVRAARRNAESSGTDLAATLADIARRDRIDSTRTADPLRRADDAIELDSTGMSIDEVVDAMLALARKAGAR